MRTSDISKYIVFSFLLNLGISSCDKNVTDFGFDGAISGSIKDQSGNIVAGDVTSNTILVKALTEGDIVTIDIRVKGDGTYENNKLYPGPTKFWITGPVTMENDTFLVDLSANNVVHHDFVVVPFLTVNLPVVEGKPTASTVTVNYKIIPNEGHVSDLRQIYCSTVPYPNANIGSGPQYETKTVNVSTDEGEVTITGLQPNTKYFIRVGARAKGTSALNYSEQIEITTP